MNNGSSYFSTGQKIIKAVKNVANEFGGDTKSTESELLMKLLNPEETSSPKGLM